MDEPRIARPELGGAEAVPLRCSGPQALDEDVGPVGEAEHDLAASLVPEVDGQRALPRVRGEEHRALALQKRRAPRARVIAAERLHLDDVRAERGEQLRGRRPGEGGRDVDDARSDERVQLAQGCVQTTCGPPSGSSTVSPGVAPSRSATRCERVFPGAMSEITPARPNQSRTAIAASVA